MDEPLGKDTSEITPRKLTAVRTQQTEDNFEAFLQEGPLAPHAAPRSVTLHPTDRLGYTGALFIG